MLTFKKVKWRNLLSTGNVFTEIELNTSKTNLIVGANGHGKSTILDAMTFVLFGKAFRNINKGGLVNSVNGKDCLVEIEFSTNGKEYRIVRGIKPNIFEIWTDGIMINQDSASRDYQEYLEKYILKMNYKAFTQIVILGSASFVPFMQLSPSDRRSIIEGLLDIQIFSVMNVLVKQRALENKQNLEKNRIELSSKQDKKSYIEKTLAGLKKTSDDRLDELQTQMFDLAQQKKTLLCNVQTIADEKKTLQSDVNDLDNIRQIYQNSIKSCAKFESEISIKDSEISFLNVNDTCQTCKQTISETFKDSRRIELNKEIKIFTDGIDAIKHRCENALERINEKETKIKRIHAITAEISAKKQTMMHIVSMINDTEDAIEKIQNADRMVQDSEKELEDTIAEIYTLDTMKILLLEDRKMIDTALALLKDGGIKTKIIKQYIPIINKLVNKYLAQMGFFVNFNIDENFNEIIKSRYRDEFSYANFSEGEKTRIDLALLFTWRAIAKMKNSVNTNLLILDEILDGSLDANGTDEFLKIIKTLTDDTNTYIISHKQDQLIDKFDKVYRFEKHRNFSRLL
jgi:DNA repair exonuclease SbcCD ATPase subunit